MADDAANRVAAFESDALREALAQAARDGCAGSREYAARFARVAALQERHRAARRLSGDADDGAARISPRNTLDPALLALRGPAGDDAFAIWVEESTNRSDDALTRACHEPRARELFATRAARGGEAPVEAMRDGASYRCLAPGAVLEPAAAKALARAAAVGMVGAFRARRRGERCFLRRERPRRVFLFLPSREAAAGFRGRRSRQNRRESPLQATTARRSWAARRRRRFGAASEQTRRRPSRRRYGSCGPSRRTLRGYPWTASRSRERSSRGSSPPGARRGGERSTRPNRARTGTCTSFHRAALLSRSSQRRRGDADAAMSRRCLSSIAPAPTRRRADASIAPAPTRRSIDRACAAAPTRRRRCLSTW